MNYLTFRKKLSDFIVISLSDIKKVEADFDHRRLNEWQEKGYLKKIRRGFYMLADLSLDESVLFLAANKIYSPSYISFEAGLRYYDLIPEAVYAITSASTKKTMAFTTPIGYFNYRKLKPALFFGYKLIDCRGHQFKMAEIEKVLLDYFYLNPSKNTAHDFEEMRFNWEAARQKIDRHKMETFLKAFDNSTLKKTINKFFIYADAQTN